MTTMKAEGSSLHNSEERCGWRGWTIYVFLNYCCTIKISKFLRNNQMSKSIGKKIGMFITYGLVLPHPPSLTLSNSDEESLESFKH